MSPASRQFGARPPGHAFYPGLDPLRGLAALSVVVYHVIVRFQWASFPIDHPVALWFRVGWLGVDLFFVISGFVVALSAFAILERNPAGFAREFGRRRLARIVPLHYLTCLLFLLIVRPRLSPVRRFSAHVLTHLTFTHNLVWQTQGSINGPNWSLGVEVQFYLLILIAAPLLLRYARPHVLLVVCIGLAWIWRAWVFAAHCGEFNKGMNMTWFGISQVPGVLDEFGIGIALALLAHRDRHGRLHRLLHAIRWLLPMAAALLARLTMRLYWTDATFWGNWMLVVFWKTLLAVTLGLVVISACAIDDWWLRALTAPFRYLGEISYGIYLWHMLVLSCIERLMPGEPAWACGWTLGLTLLLAVVSWHVFEKPLLDWSSLGHNAAGSDATPVPMARNHAVGAHGFR